MDAAKLGYGTCSERFGDPYAAERAFWDFIDERQRIWKRRQDGCLPPWTEDPILQKYHFCNVYRELDRGTIWYRENVVPTAADFPDLLWRTIVYRLVNNVKIFELVPPAPRECWQAMVGQMRELGIKPYTPAHTTFSWAGEPHTRLERFALVLERLDTSFLTLAEAIETAESLEYVSLVLKGQFGIGPFLSLQIFRDLILARAIPFNDNDWTEIGPGCAWTLKEVFGQQRPSSWRPAVHMLAYRAEEALRERGTPLLRGEPPSLNDVEHCLCELGKYVKFSQGRGRRRIYRYGGNIPSTQPA